MYCYIPQVDEQSGLGAYLSKVNGYPQFYNVWTILVQGRVSAGAKVSQLRAETENLLILDSPVVVDGLISLYSGHQASLWPSMVNTIP